MTHRAYDIPASCQIPCLAELYDRHLPDIGTFVEVGANDGFWCSNTWCLAKLGWRGIYIEPIEEYAQKCKGNHAKHNVSVLQCAVSDRFGAATLYLRGGLSSIMENRATHDQTMCAVSTRTLDSILEEFQVQVAFELLVIDVEGAELLVLEGFNIHRYHPRMAIIETHDTPEKPGLKDNAPAINSWMEKAGYASIWHDEINTVYVLNGKES